MLLYSFSHFEQVRTVDWVSKIDSFTNFLIQLNMEFCYSVLS